MRLIYIAIRRLGRRLRRQDGIVMLYALAATMIVLAASTAAVAAVTDDFPLTSVDTSQKQAFAAAQAGIQRYLFELNANSEYWTQCAPTNSNWIFNTGQTETLGTLPTVPGSSTEQYAVMLLPAAGQSTYTSCNSSNPVVSMVQAAGNGAGTIRISSTGYAGTARRTIVAALREQSFLDYSYFTKYETSAPLLQVDSAYETSGLSAIAPPVQCPSGANCGQFNNAVAGATAQCSQYRYAGRYTGDGTVNVGNYGNGNFFSYGGQSFQCDQIEFANSDQLNGPFHSDDSVLICGSPSFGRSGDSDPVEFGGPSPGYVEASGCSGAPGGSGVYAQAATLNPPTTNSLATIAGTSYSGTTCLNLTSAGIQVSQPTSSMPSCFSSGLPYTTVAYPSNGVLYVSNSSAGCSLQYDVNDPSYSGNLGCGTVYVKGSDTTPLTIGADGDIVVDGNLTYGNSTALLGLVASGFVRVYHPLSSGACTSNGGTNASGSLSNLTIDAMILSLTGSFVVDNYSCGNQLGTLTVDGGIAQTYRGAVGTGNGSTATTGYTKNYIYDSRLLYEEPPHFLTPVEGAWKIERQTECEIATTCDATS